MMKAIKLKTPNTKWSKNIFDKFQSELATISTVDLSSFDDLGLDDLFKTCVSIGSHS